MASCGGHIEVVRLLLDRGANISDRDEVSEWFFDSLTIHDLSRQICCTPLHEASSGGHIEVVRLLLDREADVQAQDKVIVEW